MDVSELHAIYTIHHDAVPFRFKHRKTCVRSVNQDEGFICKIYMNLAKLTRAGISATVASASHAQPCRCRTCQHLVDSYAALYAPDDIASGPRHGPAAG